MASVDVESIEEELTCPVRLNIPRDTPIHQCWRGHIVCGGCFAALDGKKCPTCRVQMRKDYYSIIAGISFTYFS